MENLKALRVDAGLTMKELGAEIGIAESTVSLYEGGKRADIQTLIRFADYFHVTLDYLLGREQPVQDCIAETLSKEEKELIQIYRSLNGKGKDSIMEYARERTEIPSMQEAIPSKETA